MKTLLIPFAFLSMLACTTGSSKTETTEETVKNDQATSEVPWSVRMADSEMKRNPEAWMADFRPKPKWEYTNGLICTAVERVWEKTGDEKYFNYIKEYADRMIQEDGSILTYQKEDYNIDRVNPGKFLMELYKEKPEEKYKLALEKLRDQMRSHPRTKEGGFWHKKIYPHQMWLDGLYMGSPFLAQYAVEYNEPELFDDIANQIHLIDKYTWNEEIGLYHHAWDESRGQRWSNPETGRSPHAWGRAMGWFSMALVDVLDYFPEDHPKRIEILDVTQKLADAIVKVQDDESGLWWQVLDQPEREGNYLESSASSMFVYFLVKAAKKGYIDQRYMQHAHKGYNAILEDFIREEPDGTISIINVCSVAGLGGDPYRDGSFEYYINEPKRDNDPKAVGPFILASLEFEEGL